jgi:hypothetical protein
MRLVRFSVDCDQSRVVSISNKHNRMSLLISGLGGGLGNVILAFFFTIICHTTQNNTLSLVQTF